MEYLTTKEASTFVVNAVQDGTEQYWSRRLINLRRQDRAQPYELNFAKQDGQTGLYAKAAIAAYAEFEKQRRLGKVKLSGRAAAALRAFGIGETGGTTLGRTFDGSVNLVPAETGREPTVQLIISNPLLVFALSIEQACTLGQELIEYAQAGKRIYGSARGSGTGAAGVSP